MLGLPKRELLEAQMRERGGPTTQSGILYQNSVAALYMGRLCDVAPRPNAERVTKVRVEAPEDVDDTVVTFADNHRAYIQAKENIRRYDKPWNKLWRDLDAQFQREDFQRGKDRLLLHIGEIHGEHHDLRELCERANHSTSYSEWWSRLTKSQQALVEKVKPLLKPELLSDTNLLGFFSHIDIEIWSLKQIERDMVPYWMPQSNEPQKKLFRLLRDRIGGEARHRGSFISHPLRESLEEERVYLIAPPDIDELRASIRECGALLRQHKHTFADTGRHLKRSVVDDIVSWAQESTDEESVAMLLDQAGMGKTVVARDVLCALEEIGIVVLAIKADQQLSGIATYEDLQTNLQLPDSVERVVGRLAALGLVVVLIDQIDALSLSLARDQKALNIVLELVARLRLIPGVHILLSCRTFDRNSDPALKRIEIRKQFHLTELSDEQVKDILQEVNVDFDTLLPATQKLMRVPLHLDLFVRAMEGHVSQPTDRQNAQGITSLQELYALLWRNVILKLEPDSPPASEREEVLQLMTERMNCEQRTSVPQSMFATPETQHLERAVNWLASAGILIPGATEWSFLHQTFFDYCYARRFVESGMCLAEAILNSDQGLFARPQLIHVLSYLRGSNPRTYLRELQNLLAASDLRFHLRDLLLRWFGALQNPTDDEWVVARRMFIDPAMRPRLLAAMYGNPSWFARLDGKPIQELLAQDDQTLDAQVIPYLASMLEVAQAEVINIVHPYMGRSEQWNNRLAGILSRIRKWYAVEAVDLFEKMLRMMPALDLSRIYELDNIAAAHPKAGCRLIRLVFDRVLGNYLLKQEDENTSYLLSPSLRSELESLHGGTLHEALEIVSQAEPKFYVDTMLPWLEQVVQLRNEPRNDLPCYVSDDLSRYWYDGAHVVQLTFIWTLIAALSALARTEPEEFRRVAARLAALPFETPQQLLAHVYRAVPDIYAEDAWRFLLADQRRLDLGDHEQCDSRQLIKAIYPFLSDSQRAELEAFILSYTPIWKHLGVNGLRQRGLEQLYLLQSIPVEYLTERGIRRLRELKRKFPGIRGSENPITGEGGFVGPPISIDAARKMSDKAWLRAMQKYQGGVQHKEFLKGGARELAGVLAGLVKENPERFCRLVERVPDTVDDPYVRAFIDGLAESDAPAEWLFDIVRRFAPQPGRNIKRTVAWALKKRASDGLPDDIVTLLESYVRSPQAKDENWREQERAGRDPYDRYLNSDRGSSFETLMRAFDKQGNDEAKQYKWELIEFAATDPSTALRAGAIEELLYMLSDDRERAISLFERLMEEHPALLHSPYTREFLYDGIYKHFARMKPFIRALMDEDNETCQQRGAELACIAAISLLALDSVEDQANAQELAGEVMVGPATWRRGAARVYAHNIADAPSTVCVQELNKLLNDEDADVQRLVSGVFNFLGGDHIFIRREFIQAYAASRSLHVGMRRFAEYLWEHGLLDPSWTLSVIDIILNNEHQAEESPWVTGGEELIRLVLRIYADPTADDTMREQAMNVFDRLMERYAGQAQKVLAEWDRR